MLEDMKFAFNAFARVHFSDYVLPTSEPGWVFVKAIAYFKNSLQDPGQPKGLILEEKDVGLLAEGLKWFMERMLDLQDSCYEAMQKLSLREADENEMVM
jgi:hypothetical protein